MGQVPKTFDETALRPMFEPYGKIYELRIIRNKQTGAHCGCAFLTYCKRASAEAARKNMHGVHQLQGCSHPMQVRYAEGQAHLVGEHKLFVGMVPKQATVEQLKQLFAKYGEIVEATILHDNANNSKGCGFVKFTKRESANDAIAALHQQHLMEGGAGPLVVKWADNPLQKVQRGMGPPGFRQNMPPMFHGVPPMGFHGQRMGMPPFAPFPGAPPMGRGAMPPMGGMPPPMGPAGTNPAMPPMGVPSPMGGPMGYNNMGGGGPYFPFPGQPVNSGPAASAAGAGVLAGQKGKVSGPEGSNLFLRSLPQEWGDNDLFMTFAPFGTVLSTKVVTDAQTGLSRCYGFVSFDNPQSAQAAIQSMNGMQVGATRIKVELKAERNRPY